MVRRLELRRDDSNNVVNWTYLERVPPSMHGAWPAELAQVAHRAHFLEETRPGFVLVEFISGEQAEWPLVECRVLGVESGTAPNSLGNQAV